MNEVRARQGARLGLASAVQSFVQMAFTALVVGAVVPLVVSTLASMTMAMTALCLLGTILWALPALLTTNN